MTIGENIQKYRKELGLSQEELGQKLLVSRQTISLWEKDQTIPTIDNLIRLKEIFNISVDEILCNDSIKKVPAIKPNEAYQFNFTKTELNEIYQLQKKNIYKRPIIFTLILFFLLISLIESSAQNFMIGMVCGSLFIGTVFDLKGICTYCKAWKKSVERISESTYKYEIYEYYLTVDVYHKNEKVNERKCYFSDIEQIEQIGNWLFFQFGGQKFIVRKSDLKENSVFFSYMYKNPSKKTDSTIPNKWRVPSIILFVASLLSILGALALVGTVSSANNLYVENMWLFFLLTPIPISSIILGFTLKSKGYKCKKNIIVGTIMTALLCLYGSFAFIFANVYDHSDDPIVRVEQMIDVDIPEHRQINTQDWTKGTQSVLRGYIYYTSDIYFDNDMVEQFEKQILTDDKWLVSIPNELIGITSQFSDYVNYDYILIYNTNTSEYNTLPYNSGTFRFVNILYRAEDNQMKIIEYDIDYAK